MQPVSNFNALVTNSQILSSQCPTEFPDGGYGAVISAMWGLSPASDKVEIYVDNAKVVEVTGAINGVVIPCCWIPGGLPIGSTKQVFARRYSASEGSGYADSPVVTLTVPAGIYPCGTGSAPAASVKQSNKKK